MANVSIVVPCYNEQDTIQLLLEAVCIQSYPTDDIEVIIADGMSTDHTREVIAKFQNENPDLLVKVIDNPDHSIPAGVNRAMAIAEGDYIVRMDAHSIPHRDYLTRCVDALEKGLGDNVGGIWEIRPSGNSWQSRSIAIAAAHPLGVGDARYRIGGKARVVDTVPFGAFHRELVDRIGPFDEKLMTNEDYEFNVRVRRSGGIVWMDPAIRSTYFSRGSIAELAKQYWRYGYWKARMLRRYPDTLRWRQLSGAFVLSFPILGILGIWFVLARWLLGLEVSLYALALLFVGTQTALEKRDWVLLIGVPLAIAVMHFAWGTAFLYSMFSSLFGL